MKSFILLCMALPLYVQTASALPLWEGTATYPANPDVTTGLFNTYDFGAGVALIKNDTQTGTFTGYYQTMVNGHFLSGAGVNVPGLNDVGSGSGFELTLVAEFHGISVLTPSSLAYTITDGTGSLFFDDTPDYDFAADSGFADGLKILHGTITDGTGTILFPGIIGIGVVQLSLDFAGALNFFDTDVFSPDTIAGGSALFSIKTQTATSITPLIDAVAAGANSVMGHSAVGAQLAQADGALELTAVPVPALGWMFVSGLVGLFLATSKRKR